MPAWADFVKVSKKVFTFKRLIHRQVAETYFTNPPQLVRKYTEDTCPDMLGLEK